MANPRATDGEQRGARRRRKSYSELEGRERVTLEPNVSEVRRIRVERLEGNTTARRSVAIPKMTSDSHAILPSLKSASSHRRKSHHHHRSGKEETKHRRRTRSSSKDESTYVYRSAIDESHSSRTSVPEARGLGHDENSSDSEADSTHSEPIPAKTRRRKIKLVYVDGEGYKSSKLKERLSKTDREGKSHDRDIEESDRKSRAHTRRQSVVDAQPASSHRRASTRDLPSDNKPTLKRSNTTTSHTPSFKSPSVPSLSETHTSKRSSFLGSFFGPSVQQQPRREPERLVECLTCLSDDIPRSKTAKLKCGHRMCHPCLKRIFKLSVTDPQHMPPKCCTADHIPLKHVERLFDVNFKKNWNRKYQEYTTKNRIYCPARRCGEWIKPGNIHKEDGRKYGKCSRCKTKVCCLCNGKWHGTKDCPKDEETNRLLEAAKQAGWQRCYSCRTMVELKEGCNHMTCRCTAEFCMICGLKWKSCNCPWFNYDAVEADRLNHMQVPEEAAQGQRPHRLRRPRPNNYNDEINQRRRQERADEELARRLQRATMAEDDDDYQGGIGDIHGIGNGAGHFMNQDYIRAAHNILTGTYDQATVAANYVMGLAQARGMPPAPGQRRMGGRPVASPPSPPMLRRHTMREQAYNAQVAQPSERVVPRRTRTDYASEAAVHAPIGRGPPEQASAPEGPSPRVLAGLGGSGRGSNRVNAWRTHVEAGVAPAEGVLSM